MGFLSRFGTSHNDGLFDDEPKMGGFFRKRSSSSLDPDLDSGSSNPDFRVVEPSAMASSRRLASARARNRLLAGGAAAALIAGVFAVGVAVTGGLGDQAPEVTAPSVDTGYELEAVPAEANPESSRFETVTADQSAGDAAIDDGGLTDHGDPGVPPVDGSPEVPAPAPDADSRPVDQYLAPATDVHFADCEAVWAAGAAPILQGAPGYAGHLDVDGDGIGCE